ncbi:MAG: hypothetical protein ABSC31_11305 [Acidimicrobiales bacterium]|jgi:hypothetical protein
MTAFRDTRAIISVRERASAAFLATPPSLQRTALHALGKLTRTNVPPLRVAEQALDHLSEVHLDDLRQVAAARPELDLDRWLSFASGAGLLQRR